MTGMDHIKDFDCFASIDVEGRFYDISPPHYEDWTGNCVPMQLQCQIEELKSKGVFNKHPVVYIADILDYLKGCL